MEYESWETSINKRRLHNSASWSAKWWFSQEILQNAWNIQVYEFLVICLDYNGSSIMLCWDWYIKWTPASHNGVFYSTWLWKKGYIFTSRYKKSCNHAVGLTLLQCHTVFPFPKSCLIGNLSSTPQTNVWSGRCVPHLSKIYKQRYPILDEIRDGGGLASFCLIKTHSPPPLFRPLFSSANLSLLATGLCLIGILMSWCMK